MSKNYYTIKDYLYMIFAVIIGLFFALAIIGGMFLQQTRFIFFM